jgi:DNA-binding winged helix-turn-helix (wHTH) protein
VDALNQSDILQFGPFRFDRRGGLLLRCTDGDRYLPVNIGSRAIAVLEALTERPGDLVSKDEIMRAAWPGTVVEEGNLTMQISTLRRILDDGSETGSCIKTVSGRGYRFVVPVSRIDVLPTVDRSASVRDTAVPDWHIRSWRWLAAGMGAVAIIASVMAAIWLGGWSARTPVPPRLSLVVLPFQNLSDDPKDDYLADGITDDLTSDLSNIPGALVAARET